MNSKKKLKLEIVKIFVTVFTVPTICTILTVLSKNKISIVLSIAIYIATAVISLVLYYRNHRLSSKNISGILNSAPDNKYKRQYNESMRDKFIDSLISTRYDNLPEDDAKKAGISFLSTRFFVILADIYNLESFFEGESINDAEKKDEAVFIIKNVFEELLGKYGKAYVFSKDGKVVCVVNLDDNEAFGESDIFQTVEYGKKFIETQFSISMALSISTVKDVSSLPEAYDEVLLLKKKLKFLRNKEIAFYSELSNINGADYDEEGNERIKDAISKGMILTASDLFKLAADSFISETTDADTEFKLFSVKMINMIISRLPTNRQNKEESIYISKILEFESYEKCKEEFLSLIKYVCEYSKENNAQEDDNLTTSLKMVSRMKKCIEQNYSDDALSLTYIGTHVGVTPYYASHVFKEITGKNLSDYINRYRVDRARKILQKDSKLPISKLYEQVGFGSERTFIRTFTKYEGVTVGQYKDSLKKTEL